MTDKPAAVYRYYDTDGLLLYVGSSTDPDQREYNHQLYSDWYGLAVRRTTEWYSCRRAAFRAEMEAIRAEQPAHNRQRYIRHADTDHHAARIRIPRATVAEIDRMALDEERDRSAMIRILLKEAIEARRKKGWKP